jgi:hypothetical protein
LLSELPINEQGCVGQLYRTLAGWGRAELAENHRTSLFNEDLSSDTIFSQIHPDVQHL